MEAVPSGFGTNLPFGQHPGRDALVDALKRQKLSCMHVHWQFEHIVPCFRSHSLLDSKQEFGVSFEQMMTLDSKVPKQLKLPPKLSFAFVCW